MTHPISLAFLTTFDVGPVEAINIAAETGYDMVGLRFLPAGTEPDYPIMSSASLQKEAEKALKETGIQLADIEIIRLKSDTDIANFEAFCELGQRLDARHILVAGDDPEQARLTQNFALFCELAAKYNMTADLEFMPWTAVKNLRDARKIVADANHKNGGVLVDALHFDRSHSTLAEISSMPAAYIHYAQICDGLVPYNPNTQDIIRVAREDRLLPGDGGIDLAGLLRALPDTTPISVEIPQRTLAITTSPKDRARVALDRTRALLS